MTPPTRSTILAEHEKGEEIRDCFVQASTDSTSPQFDSTATRTCLTDIEQLFAARGITSQVTEYACVLATLPTRVLGEVIDIIDSEPSEHRHDKLGAALIQRTTVSDEKRTQHLLTACELGTERPSHSLRHMRRLMRSCRVDELIPRQMCLQRLPRNKCPTNANDFFWDGWSWGIGEDGWWYIRCIIKQQHRWCACICWTSRTLDFHDRQTNALVAFSVNLTDERCKSRSVWTTCTTKSVRSEVETRTLKI